MDFGAGLGEVLGQEDDDKGQTRRMAMTVLADALVFHAALAETRLHLPAEGPGGKATGRPAHPWSVCSHPLARRMGGHP